MEARKLLRSQKSLWAAVPVAERDARKEGLLYALSLESVSLVRNALARVLAETVKSEHSLGSWPTLLLQHLVEASGAQSPAQREVGVYCLYTLVEALGPEALLSVQGLLSDLLTVFSRTLSDTDSSNVRVNSLLGLGPIADAIDPTDQENISRFRSLIPLIVKVLQDCLQRSDSDGAAKAFELFDSLLVLETPLLSQHFGDLVQLYLSIAGNKDHDETVRLMALSFLMWCTLYKKGKLQRLGLVQPMVAAMMPIGAEGLDEENHSEEMMGATDDSAAKLAFQVLSSLATNLAPSLVYPDVMTGVVAFSQSQDPGHRKAAMLALSVIVDGCADYMRSRTDDFFGLLCAGLQDPVAAVRNAACTALGSLADEVEELTAQHAALLPFVLNLMSDPDASLHYNAISALDAIVEGMEDQIIPYLPTLMVRLLYLLDGSERRIRVIATACIGSAAHAAGSEFRPYFSQVIGRLTNLMRLGEDKDDLDLRGVATDTVSTVAEAVGKEDFRPHVQELMMLGIQGLSIDSSRLRECSYCFFALLARVFEEEFAPFLAVILPHIISSLKLEEKDFLSSDAGMDAYALSRQAQDEDDDDEDGAGITNVNSAIAEEKETSLDALSELFSATKSAFIPYVQETVNIALSLLEHYHESVRRSAVSCLFTFLQTFYKMSSPSDWVPGLPLVVPVHNNVSQLTKLVIEGVLKALEDEDDRYDFLFVISLAISLIWSNRQTVSAAFNDFTETLKLMGPALLSQSFNPPLGGVVSHFDGFCIQLLDVLRKEHVCQSDREEMEDRSQDDDEEAEQDAIVINSAADTVAALASAMGPSFSPYFRNFFPLLAKYYKPSRSEVDRNMAIGAIAETAAGMGAGVTDYTNELLSLFSKGLTDEDEEVKSNSAYGIGILCENSQVDLSVYVFSIFVVMVGYLARRKKQTLCSVATTPSTSF